MTAAPSGRAVWCIEQGCGDLEIAFDYQAGVARAPERRERFVDADRPIMEREVRGTDNVDR
ncbi:MAG: hypothetical protein AAFU80_16455 [Pseudomonadota bacterium]